MTLILDRCKHLGTFEQRYTHCINYILKYTPRDLKNVSKKFWMLDKYSDGILSTLKTIIKSTI